MISCQSVPVPESEEKEIPKLPAKSTFRQYLDPSDLYCLRSFYSIVDEEYQWIQPADSLRIDYLKNVLNNPLRYGLKEDHSYSIERARSIIRRHLPDQLNDRNLISELSYTLLFSQFVQAALNSNGPGGSPSLDYCRDSLLQITMVRAIENDDVYAGLLEGLPGDIGNKFSWIGEFYDSAGLDYAGHIVPDYKEDSAGCMTAVQLALQDLSILTAVDSLVDSTALYGALKTFQFRSGLEPDGVVGKLTRDAFAKTNQERYKQILANLERSRQQVDWQKGEFHIEVNVPEMALRFYMGDKVISRHRVVIGKRKDQRTPSFKASINEIVVNPEWNVPYSISTKELLPNQLADSNYLTDHHYRVTNSYIESIDPLTIDWKELNENYFPYRIIQSSGPWNALGTVKFLFPNRHQVYIHDTPSKSLFFRTQRDFSHGCIRVQDPYDLAMLILKNSKTKIDSVKFFALLDTATNRSIPIYPKIPVHVNYGSVRKDESTGALIFYHDIYGRDEE